jgi:hypothetical protein
MDELRRDDQPDVYLVVEGEARERFGISKQLRAELAKGGAWRPHIGVDWGLPNPTPTVCVWIWERWEKGTAGPTTMFPPGHSMHPDQVLVSDEEAAAMEAAMTADGQRHTDWKRLERALQAERRLLADRKERIEREAALRKSLDMADFGRDRWRKAAEGLTVECDTLKKQLKGWPKAPPGMRYMMVGERETWAKLSDCDGPSVPVEHDAETTQS